MSKQSKPITETVTEKAAVQPNTKPDSKRRNFLIGAGLGSVGAAAALVGAGAIKPTAEPTAEKEVEGKGYRETEHVRRYYGTTRI